MPAPRITALAAAIVPLFVASIAWSQGPASTQPNPSAVQQDRTSKADRAMNRSADSSVARSDRKFVENAAQGGIAEVELGKLAQEKAANAQVKAFGERMMTDHTKANEELKKIASSKGIEVPSETSGANKREYDRLAKLSGDKFDREYMEHMVKDHKKDVSEFRSEAKSGKDADIKAFAEKTLPTLEQHLKMAQDAEAAVKGREKSASSAPRTTSGGMAK